jgi:septal ring factor EnvC (AmiA/AmiB activator)
MRRALRSSLLLFCLVSSVAVAAPPGRPSDADATRQQMQDAERARAAELSAQKQAAARAAAAAEAGRKLAAERVAAAQRLRQAENATAVAAQRMAELARQQQESEARLAARAADLAPLLPLVERLSLYPAETLLAVPTDPETALTGVLVLRGLTQQLERDAAALRREQAALEATRLAMAAEAPRLAAAQSAQATQAAELDRQIAATEAGRREATSEADAAARRAADLAAKAESLRAVIAAIEAERRAAEARARAEAALAEKQKHSAEAEAARRRQEALARPTGAGTIAPAARPHGQLTTPVAGRIIRDWGDPTDAGPATGITYQAPPAARIVSPCSGRVVFGAPFRSFGLLLIVDCGGGYHAVLAGFERLDTQVGRSVQAGEPVGTMPSWDPRVPGSHPGLYVELRHDGLPVNPTPWLRTRG